MERHDEDVNEEPKFKLEFMNEYKELKRTRVNASRTISRGVKEVKMWQ